MRFGDFSFHKAGVTEDGKPFSDWLANGTKKDSYGESMTKEGMENIAKAADEGKIPLTPAHNVPIPLATSTKGWVENDTLYLRMEHDTTDPLSMKLHKSIEDGSYKGGASLGGEKCVTRDKARKTYTPKPTDDAPVHFALTMPHKAAYEEAGALGAFYRALDEGDQEGMGKEWTPEKAAQVKEGMAKGEEIWDTSTAVGIAAQVVSALSSVGYLFGQEARESHPEAAEQLDALKTASEALKAAIKAVLQFAASEIGEVAGQVEVASSTMMLTKHEGGEWGFSRVAPEPQPPQAPTATTPEVPATEAGASMNKEAMDGFTKTLEGFGKTLEDLQKAISDGNGKVEELSKAVAEAQGTLTAWGPIMDKVRNIPLPAKGAKAGGQAFAKSEDKSTSAGTQEGVGGTPTSEGAFSKAMEHAQPGFGPK